MRAAKARPRKPPVMFQMLELNCTSCGATVHHTGAPNKTTLNQFFLIYPDGLGTVGPSGLTQIWCDLDDTAGCHVKQRLPIVKGGGAENPSLYPMLERRVVSSPKATPCHFPAAFINDGCMLVPRASGQQPSLQRVSGASCRVSADSLA